jgi:hypothetical protein
VNGQFDQTHRDIGKAFCQMVEFRLGLNFQQFAPGWVGENVLTEFLPRQLVGPLSRPRYPSRNHEKWDGSGYPHGLKGAQIPLVARIFSVVDVWDALNSDRLYRAACAEEKVREHILTSSGIHFDPQVVDVFMQISDLV